MDDNIVTPAQRETMEEWLVSGTAEQKRHAIFRLSQPDVELKYPSLFRQAANAAQAVGAVVASAVRGEPVTVPQEEQNRRLAICHACEFWDPKQGRCSKCGCFGAWKTWLASQRCPIGKW
jgi:hypothetical protein